MISLNKYLKYPGILISFLLLSACDLTETPTSFVNSDNYYKTESQCISGLNSCYIPLKTIYNFTYMMITEGVTDLMYIRSGTQDAQLAVSPAQPRYGSTMWTQGYKGVMYSNAVIDGIAKSPVPEELKKPLLAEGIIMRAYYYWFLTCTFGDVPFYTEHVANMEVLERISRMGRMSAVDTRNYLIDELLNHVYDLPQIRTSEVKDNRCGAAMGWMLIGKLAQWNKRWDIARDA
ncbi:MAG: RagB/SusD family nutrient uptake outer membrane protein, partial [Bacteroidales bacterium]